METKPTIQMVEVSKFPKAKATKRTLQIPMVKTLQTLAPILLHLSNRKKWDLQYLSAS
jgi:hypothetical protein